VDPRPQVWQHRAVAIDPSHRGRVDRGLAVGEPPRGWIWHGRLRSWDNDCLDLTGGLLSHPNFRLYVTDLEWDLWAWVCQFKANIPRPHTPHHYFSSFWGSQSTPSLYKWTINGEARYFILPPIRKKETTIEEAGSKDYRVMTSSARGSRGLLDQFKLYRN